MEINSELIWGIALAVLPAVLPYIIPVLYRCYRTQQLEAINITLKSILRRLNEDGSNI